MSGVRGAIVLLLCGLWACSDAVSPPVGLGPPDAALDHPWFDAGAGVSASDEARPTITIQQVLDEGDTAWVRGVAADDRQVTRVEVKVGLSGPYLAALARATGEPARWEARVPLPPAGTVVVAARAYDGGGRHGDDSKDLVRPEPAPGEPPVLQVLAPEDGLATHAPAVVFRGTAFDPLGVSVVEVNGARTFFGAAQTVDHFATWTKTVALRPGAEERFEVVATNAAGQKTRVWRTVTSRGVPPHGPPVIAETDPMDGAVVPDPDVSLRVRVTPAVGLDDAEPAPLEAVEVRVDDGPWRPASAQAGDWWLADIRVPPRHHDVQILARDVDGVTAVADVRLSGAVDRWGDGPEVVLHPPGPRGGRVRLSLDREGLTALFGDVADDIVVLTLEATPLFERALASIRAACGPGWRQPDFAPACPEGWGAAERAIWRALTRTADSAAWDASSVGRAALTADAVLDRPFSAYIAPALGLADPADLLLPERTIARALAESLLGSHPNAAGAHLGVTLTDALTDLDSLADRFGPAGDHPGVMGGPSSGHLFDDDLRVELDIDSNLRVLEGVDLVAGRRAYFGAPMGGAPVAELDFEDPERFSVVGLADAPSLRFGLRLETAGEAPVPADDADEGPEAGAVWSRPVWSLEHMAAASTLGRLADARYGCDLCEGPESGAAVERDRSGRVDLLEITVGRLGYDCAAGGDCPRGRPTPPGVSEHFPRFDRADCAQRAECDNGSVCARAGRDDDRGRCVPIDALSCMRDDDCADGACLAGACVAADRIECRTDVDCADADLCHDGRCRAVPAGWLRLWVAGDAALAPPAFLWDLVAELVGLEVGGRGRAQFDLPEVALEGFDAVGLEARLRQSLHAQRRVIAQRLLGALPAQGERVDLYLDRAEDGAVWLLVSGCGGDGRPCDGPSDGRLQDEQNQPLNRVGPGGRIGLPLTALSPGQSLYLQRGEALLRVDVRALDPADQEVTLWLRPTLE